MSNQSTDDTDRFYENIERLRERWRGSKQELKGLFNSDEDEQSDTDSGHSGGTDR